MIVMNRQVIIDSNIVIYAALPQHIELREWLKFTNIFTSAISEIEVLGFSKLTPGDKIYFEEFFSTCTIISIKEKHIRKAIELRQEKR